MTHFEFPQDEEQMYRFKFQNEQFQVDVRNGNHTVTISGSAWPNDDPPFVCNEELLDYWIGVVYSYKMSDDTTGNYYTCADYTAMAYVCRKLQVCPEFEELERIIGYSFSYNSNPLPMTAVFANAENWQRQQQALKTGCNAIAEGAD